jgi:hypothetical protein
LQWQPLSCWICSKQGKQATCSYNAISCCCCCWCTHRNGPSQGVLGSWHWLA